jgi:dihydropyrimidine dehydrogenase (NAD+) subunit PreT
MPPGLFAELRPPLTDAEAVVEAARCVECGGPHAPAPCVVACPADVDVPRFVTELAEGDSTAAAETILRANILGATCARVCPVEVLCQGSCVLLHEGRRAVEVGALQRYATDRALAEGLRPRRPAPPNGRRVAVVGAGPAGLACAGELALLGYDVTVHEARSEIGGLVRYAIAPYRQQREPLPEEQAMLEELGVRFRLGSAVRSAEALRALEAEVDAIFLGIGMGDDVEPPFPGAELEGVWQSLHFIERLKTGEPPELGERMVVAGGGNTAIDVAREGARLGAEVTLVYRRSEAEMPAYPHEVEEAREEGVRFRLLANPTRFLGEERLEGVECLEMRLGDPDDSGRRRPEPVPGSEFVLPADTAVLAIGQQARAEFLSWIDGLELEWGLLQVDPDTGATGNPKYFGGGDAANGGATVVEAVRAAKIAARGIHARLSGATREEAA